MLPRFIRWRETKKEIDRREGVEDLNCTARRGGTEKDRQRAVQEK